MYCCVARQTMRRRRQPLAGKGAGRSPVSRILSPPGPIRRSGRSFVSPPKREPLARLRLLPGDSTGGRPFPCSVLHRAGFAVPPSLPSARWALTPPFHPYPPSPRLRRAGPSHLGSSRRFAFCCTFRPAALKRPSPVFTRRAALWCPDFPRSRRNGTAIARGAAGGASLRKGQVPRTKFQAGFKNPQESAPRVRSSAFRRLGRLGKTA
ncbi:hypothetical protein Hhel01_03611 [Haloferula helveola]